MMPVPIAAVMIVRVAVPPVSFMIAGQPGPDSLDMVVVALLNQADLILEPQRHLAVFA